LIYTIGQTAILSGTFLDPTSHVGLTLDNLELRIQPPGGIAEVAIIGVPYFGNPSPGVYTYGLFLNASGVWLYRFVTTGTYSEACEGKLTVAVSPFTFPP
jgi:hypothetical protein